MSEMMTPTQARAALKRHRGVVLAASPLPDDWSYLPITKRAAGMLIADAEAVKAWLLVGADENGFLVISANAGYMNDGGEV